MWIHLKAAAAATATTMVILSTLINMAAAITGGNTVVAVNTCNIVAAAATMTDAHINIDNRTTTMDRTLIPSAYSVIVLVTRVNTAKHHTTATNASREATTPSIATKVRLHIMVLEPIRYRCNKATTRGMVTEVPGNNRYQLIILKCNTI